MAKEKKKELSPMMKHYQAVKEMYKDCIVFYRLGDFYEMFFEDAVEVSQILDLTLTGKECGLEKRAPMCGIPYHASQTYIAKLIEAGKKIAVVEQLTKPTKGNTLVEREVVRVITPGTVLDENCLTDDKNNFIACIYKSKSGIGICWADISTGLMQVSEFSGASALKNLDDLLSKIKPAELICNSDALPLRESLTATKTVLLPNFTPYKDISFNLSRATKEIKEQFQVANIAVFDLQDYKNATVSAGALLEYLQETQMKMLNNLKSISVFKDEKHMHLDFNARKNLELTENMLNRKKGGSLLGLLDETKSSLGARKMRSFVENPLLDETEINMRLDGVEELTKNLMVRETSGELFSGICDIERICSKIAIGSVTPKDCFNLGQSLLKVPEIKAAFSNCSSKIIADGVKGLVDVCEIAQMLQSAFDEFAPINYKDGGFIKPAFDEKLDSLKKVSDMGYSWITKFENEEKEKTGIRTLKVNYNKVFGYCIEITKSFYNQVPDNYILKQTMKDSQKYVTPELKEAERLILSGAENALVYELEVYDKIKDFLAKHIQEFLSIANSIALLDVLVSLAKVSVKNNYVRPIIGSFVKEINIVGGRHPVIEKMMGSNQFVDNDTLLDDGENNILIITGPNMGGKSTYMRQVAIIVIMAHIGCFVPATRASIALTDRIFTRIGASDELSLGNSTFMVEMTEVSNIINNATKNSLIILDEVGRGTSTFDGMSIAWAIIEYLSANVKAKTLFATHYHELTVLEEKIVGVKNYRVLAKEFDNSIIFLHKIARGSANRSFGIEVASLAGLPQNLIDRAKDILKAQEQANNKIDVDNFEGTKMPEVNPNAVEVINVLKEMDMNTISPLMAFGTLQNLVDKVKNN